MTADEVLSLLSVSRETEEGIKTFAAHVERWTKRINLIGKATVDDLWSRHILDSAQIYRLISRPVDHWLDLGSGGGFPAIVCSLLSRDQKAATRFTLVESDKRKAAFLSTVVRELNLSVTVKSERIESLACQCADVVSARALAPLEQLLGYSAPHIVPGALLLFPKGAGALDEIHAARRTWRFTHETHQSITNASARIILCSSPQRLDLIGCGHENDLRRKSKGWRR